MFEPRKGTAARRAGATAAAVAAVAAIAATAVLAGCGRSATTTSNDRQLACGSATVRTIAAVDATAANRIYGNELAGTEVSFDVAQVSGASDLIAAVAADNAAAARVAVSRLVYHPAWHIVRLQALDGAGRILADVGGPYVIAPVRGTLRSLGRVVGSFVMSVQDDVGYTKLETRFVGDPVAVYVGGTLVAQRFAAFPSTPPSGAAVSLGGVGYLAVTEIYEAFPAGTLAALILVPPAPAALARESCAAVRAGEFGRIAERFALLAVALPQHYPGFARTVTIYTGADVFVRDASGQLASSGGAGPARLPDAGEVGYVGRRWLVFSFVSRPGTRVYVLAPPG